MDGSGGTCTDMVLVESANAAGYSFDRDAASRAQANLELRIGELEELEQTLRGEIDGLYGKSEALTSRNVQLETHSAHQAARIDDLERAFAELEHQKVGGAVGAAVLVPAAAASPSYSFALPSEASPRSAAPAILLRDVAQSTVDEKEHARVAEIALRGEQAKLDLLKSQLSSAKNSWDLRSEQYDSRLQKQETDLRDLEQQLSSLYAAFGFVTDEHTAEKEKNESLRSVLQESDFRLAQEAHVKEEHGLKRPPATPVAKPIYTSPHSAASPAASGSRRPSFMQRNKGGQKKTPFPPSPAASPAAGATRSVSVKPGKTVPLAQGYLLLYQDGKSSTPRSSSSPLSPKIGKVLGRHRNGGSGKRQYCLLHGVNGLYQLRYGDDYTSPINGVLEFITAGVSSVEHTDRSSKKEFGFEIAINPKDKGAPTLCCAAYGEEDYMKWLSALARAIAGVDSAAENAGARTAASAQVQSPTSTQSPRGATTLQEELDHEMAMKMHLGGM